jgi:acyl-CoA thioesterase-1
VDSTQANIAAIVERIRAAQPAARVLLVQMEAPPNFGAAYTSEFRAMFPAVAERYGLTLAPFLLDRVAGVASLNQGDGVHPNEAGARIVADNVWRALRPVVEGR